MNYKSAIGSLAVGLLFGLVLSLIVDRSDERLGTSQVNQEKVIKENLFDTHRGIAFYRSLLGPKFAAHLDRLNHDGHWMDIGAGEFFALVDYMRKKPHDTMPRLSGVTVETIGWSVIQKFRELFYSAEQYLRLIHQYTGHYLEDYCATPSEVKDGIDCKTHNFQDMRGPRGADVVTDLYGAFSYSARIDEILASYVKLLADKDSRIYINGCLPCITTPEEEDACISYNEGFERFKAYAGKAGFVMTYEPLEPWQDVLARLQHLALLPLDIAKRAYASARGFNVSGTYRNRACGALELRVSDEAWAKGFVEIPGLKLDRLRPGTPPYRELIEDPSVVRQVPVPR